MAKTQNQKQLNIVEIQDRIEKTIRAVYPSTFNFNRAQTAELLGCSVGHLSNSESAKTPLIEPSQLQGKIVYSFNRIVDTLVEQEIATLGRIYISKNKRKPGRPSKVSIFLKTQIAQKELGGQK